MKKNRVLKVKSWPVLAFICFLISFISITTFHLKVFEQIELNSLDFRFRFFPIDDKADSTIVLVAIDNQSLNYARSLNMLYPWAREYYGHITNFLRKCEAEQVIFDILFVDPDYDRAEIDSATSDNYFMRAIRNNGKVILGAQIVSDSSDFSNKLERFAIEINDLTDSYPSIYGSISYPIDILMKHSQAIGILNIMPDQDGVIRRVPLFYKLNDYYFPQVSFSTWLAGKDDKISIEYRPGNFFKKASVQAEDYSIELIDSKNYLINWYGKGDVDGVFRYIPFSALLQSAAAMLQGKNPTINPEFFKGKTLIIGATAPGLLDLKTSPITKVMPGMEVWATILSNLRNRHFIKQISNIYLYLIVFLLSFGIIFVFAYKKPFFSHIFLIINLLIIHLFIFILWHKSRVFIPWFIFVLTILLSYITILLLNFLAEGKARQELRRIFSRYVHPDLINILVKNADEIEMGGEEIEATVLFTDIYNFTDYSEKKKPKTLVYELNNYFENFTGIILNHNGMLDKYTGDGLMAIFGAPLNRTDHALLACKAAIAHKKFAQSLNESDEYSFFHKKTRIGINSGQIVVGNIGSTKRADYTAIGDPVNLSARLEAVNKIFKTSIIIGENTWLKVKDLFICRELDQLKVKGKNEPTRIFELIDEIEFVNDKTILFISQYQKALSFYQAGDFLKAKTLFEKVYLLGNNDQASYVMKERCEFLINNPPEEWDGIFRLTVK